MLGKREMAYLVVGAVGIYLAHGIENKVQNPEGGAYANIDHINRVAFYWSIGAGLYFLALKAY